MDNKDLVLLLKQNCSGSGMTEDVKQAFLNAFSHVAWTDEHGQDYYDALEAAFYPSSGLVGIAALYTQSGTVYDTDSLDSLRDDLVVTATYADNTVRTVTAYTLSGTLTVGTSTITVSYGGKTATFTVTVTQSLVPSGYTQYDYLALDYADGTDIGGANNAILVPNINIAAEYSYEIEFSYNYWNDSDGGRGFLGTRVGQSGAKKFGLFCTPATGKLGYWFDGTDTTTSIVGLIAGAVNKIKILPVGASTQYPNNVVIDLNGTEYNTQATTASGIIGSYLGLFKYAISSSSVKTSFEPYYGAKLGRFIVKNGNSVVYDFIPANNGIYYGYYERVTREFYTLLGVPEKCIGGNWS
jgi:hypothetical protein